MTTLFFIRHGEVVNPKNILYGRTIPVPLSKKGIEQMKHITLLLERRNIVPDIIFVSPLKRTTQSAEILHSAFPKTPVIFDKNLLEVDTGLEGKSLDWVAHINGDIYSQKQKENCSKEQPKEIVKRMMESVKRIKKMYKNKTIFIVSHGDPLAFLLWKLIYPQAKIPSIVILEKKMYLMKGEACKVVLNGNKVISYEMIKRVTSSDTQRLTDFTT